MTTAENIASLEAAIADAQATLARAQAEQAAEQTEQPRKLGWADGVAAAHRRHPHLKKAADEAAAAAREAARPADPTEDELGGVARTPEAAYVEKYGLDITTVAGAIAEARRRGAARKSSHR